MARVVWKGKSRFSHSRAVKWAVVSALRGDFELRCYRVRRNWCSTLIQSMTRNLRCLLLRRSRSCDICIGNGLSGSSRYMIISLSWLTISTSFSESNLPSGLKPL